MSHVTQLNNTRILVSYFDLYIATIGCILVWSLGRHVGSQIHALLWDQWKLELRIPVFIPVFL